MKNLCIVISLFIFTLSFFAYAGDYDPTMEIQKAQEKIQREKLGWTAGYNPVMDIPPEERDQLLGLYIPERARLEFERINSFPVPALTTTADYFNWQEFNCVSPVDDQRTCGSCWDFAATHAFEAAYIIATGEVEDFSEQQSLVCNTGGSDCGGGWMEDTYNVFMNYGAVEEECMPYYANDNYACTQDQCTPVAFLDDYVNIPNNVNAIKNALMYGPLSTTFTVYDDFYSYRGGCYDHADVAPLNHAVVIVGWDDEMCDGEGAWIVKNSWNASFGVDGFFYMKYTAAGIGEFTQRPIYGETFLPELSLASDSIAVELPQYGQEVVNLDFSNYAPGKLRYKVTLAQPEGQDEFGYYWRDSNQPDGPTYNWIDITNVGQELEFPYGQDDGNSGWMDFGFEFDYYGNTYHRFKVCTNGWVSFMDGWFINSDNLGLPDELLPNDLLAVWWDDLDLEYSGNIYFYSNNADTAIVTWDNVADNRNVGRYTFQAIFVAPSTIIYQYNDMGDARLDEASIGIENRYANIGLTVARNEAYIEDGMAVGFYLGDSNSLTWLQIADSTGIVEPYSTYNLPITFDATGLEFGEYNAVLRILTNDINMLVNEIPVTLSVGTVDVGDIAELPSEFALKPSYPNPFNANTMINYSLAEPGQMTLDIYNLTGQKVVTLYNGYQSTGAHSVSWHAENYSSGIYFVRLTQGDNLETQRLTLIK